MNIKELEELIKKIVHEAVQLKNEHTDAVDIPVNYICLFSQSDDQFEELKSLASKLGSVIKETPTGPLFHISPISTTAGQVQLLKVRIYDKTRPELGDADFTHPEYLKFKDSVLKLAGFSLIKRETMEMIELYDKKYNVRAYFSHPPLDVQLGIK
jgi:hypothetical protein